MGLNITPETQFVPVNTATPEAPHEVYFWDQAGAAFMNNTFTGAFAEKVRNDSEGLQRIPDEPTFDLFQHLTPDELAQPARFSSVGSADELVKVREQKARYDRRNEIIAAGPVNPLLLALFVNFVDPVNYLSIPLGGATTTLGRTALAGVEGAILAGGTVAAQSTFDPETSLQDAAIATVAGATLGSGFRAAMGLMKRNQTPMDKLQEVGEEVAGLMRDKRVVVAPESAGAAKMTSELSPEATMQVRSLRFGTKTSGVGILPPAEELGNSDLTSVRSIIAEMYDLGTVTKGELLGYRTAGPSLHTQNMADDATLAQLHNGLQLSYKEGKTTGNIPSNMTFEQFDSELGRALNNGDVHPIKAVEDAAKQIRKNILDPMKEELERTGIIDVPGVVKGAKTYFPHVHDVHAIRSGRVNKFGQTYTEAIAAHIKSQQGPDAEFAEGIAEEVYEKIVNKATPGAMARIVLGPRGMLKERSLEIPYSVLEPWLNNSAEVVLGRYVRSVAPDVRIYDKYGALDFDKALTPRVRDEVAQLRKAVEADPSLSQEQIEKRLTDLGKHEERMLELLRYGWDNLRGLGARSTMPAAGRTLTKAIKAATFSTSLPLVALAQIPDMGAIILKEGIARTFGSALTTLYKGLQGVKTISLKESQSVGQGIENTLNSRTNAIFGIQDMYGSEGRVDRALGKFSNLSSKLFLLNAMTVGAKAIAAGAVTTRMLTNAIDVEKAYKVLEAANPQGQPADWARQAVEQVMGKSDLRRMAQARINPQDLVRMAAQKQHFVKEGANLVGNVELWDDPAAMRAYRLGLASSVANGVITPTAMDAPMWTSSEVGSIVATYKRFMYAAYHKVMVAGLQQRDASMFLGFAAMSALGAISLAARDMGQNGGELKERTPAQWIRESVDRSGIATAMFEAENWAAMVGLPTTETLVGRAGEKPGTTIADRFASGGVFSKKPTEQVAGPVGGYANNLFSAIGTAKKLMVGEEITEGEVHKATRLIPWRNLLGIGYLVDQLEHYGAEQGLYKPKKEQK